MAGLPLWALGAGGKRLRVSVPPTITTTMVTPTVTEITTAREASGLDSFIDSASATTAQVIRFPQRVDDDRFGGWRPAA